MPDVKDRLQIGIKRAYDGPARSDGQRVLVDRVWPRGLTKEALRLDDWVKEVAPSSQLRKWFDHDPAKWGTFKKRYFRELDEIPDTVEAILAKARKGRLTLIYGARDTEFNNAAALKEYLECKAQEQAAAE